MLKIINLTCTRGDRSLFAGLNFDVKPGKLLHIRGQNGSGKTTLLRTLCGLFLQDTGEVQWGGKNIRSLQEEYRKQLLYLGHHNAIKDELTGLENLHIQAQLSGEKFSEKQCWQALEKIGLRGYEDLPTKVLSQGQKRRVALSRLLLSKAKLWILDEPFTALDISAVDLLQSIIRTHVENNGIVLLTTHQEVSLTSGQSQQLQLGN